MTVTSATAVYTTGRGTQCHSGVPGEPGDGAFLGDGAVWGDRELFPDGRWLWKQLAHWSFLNACLVYLAQLQPSVQHGGISASLTLAEGMATVTVAVERT